MLVCPTHAAHSGQDNMDSLERVVKEQTGGKMLHFVTADGGMVGRQPPPLVI